MKKTLIVMMMLFAGVGNAHAVDFDFNENVLTQTVLTTVIKTVMGDKKNVEIGGGGVTIGTAGVTGKGKLTKCWTHQVYNANGDVTTKVTCY